MASVTIVVTLVIGLHNVLFESKMLVPVNGNIPRDPPMVIREVIVRIGRQVIVIHLLVLFQIPGLVIDLLSVIILVGEILHIVLVHVLLAVVIPAMSDMVRVLVLHNVNINILHHLLVVDGNVVVLHLPIQIPKYRQHDGMILTLLDLRILGNPGVVHVHHPLVVILEVNLRHVQCLFASWRGATVLTLSLLQVHRGARHQRGMRCRLLFCLCFRQSPLEIRLNSLFQDQFLSFMLVLRNLYVIFGAFGV